MIEFQYGRRNLINKKIAGLQNGNCGKDILARFNRFGPDIMNAAFEIVKACGA